MSKVLIWRRLFIVTALTAIFVAKAAVTRAFSPSNPALSCGKPICRHRVGHIRWDLEADTTGYGAGGGAGDYGPPSPLPSSPSASGPWRLDNSFDFFLNQCAIQSLLFLINSLKDRHTAIWLEDFTQPTIRKRTREMGNSRYQVLSNMASAVNDALHETQVERPIRLLTYHGLAAINTTLFATWDSYFEQLLQKEAITYTIESSRPHVPTYELEINPSSLCSRIISVREQIAREFVHDLDVIAETSMQTMETYWKAVKVEQNGQPLRLPRTNQLFLEMSVDEDYAPSPLRKGNFDLLTLLTTQEAIHRILNRLFSSSAEECPADDSEAVDLASGQYLRNFYTQRVGTHFTGSNFYGRAEDFLDELVQALPSVVQLQDAECGLVDPVRIVERILEEREKVASEWLEASLDVPMSHTAIKRWQLNKLMGISNKNAGSASSIDKNSSFE